MIFFISRREREKRIISFMVRLYCESNHSPSAVPCDECNELITYAFKRLDHCKFGDQKPVCKDCPVHCYSPAKKENMKKVMRWAGPRMIYRHPVYAMIHTFDSFSSKNTD